MTRTIDNLSDLSIQEPCDGISQRAYDGLRSIVSNPVLKQLTYERLDWIDVGIRLNTRTSELLYEAGLPDQANKLYLCRNSFDLETFQDVPQTVPSNHCDLTHFCQFCAWRRGNRLYKDYKRALDFMLSMDYVIMWLTLSANFTNVLDRDEFRLLWDSHRALMRSKVMKPVRGCLSFMEAPHTDSGWLLHIHSILFLEDEVKHCYVANLWSSINSCPNAVHLLPANPADLRRMILYGCKHQEFSSAAYIKNYFEETDGFRMARSRGATLRRASAESRKTRKTAKLKHYKDVEDQSRRQKVLSNIDPRSNGFQELLRRMSPGFARFADVV